MHSATTRKFAWCGSRQAPANCRKYVLMAPAAPPPQGGPPDRKLTVLLPATVLRQLRTRVAEDDTTMRALVLDALARAGYQVDAAEIRDRRRSETRDGERR